MLVPDWALQFVGGKERFLERSGGGAYVPKIATQNTAKWGGQNGAMIFQTRSNVVFTIFSPSLSRLFVIYGGYKT